MLVKSRVSENKWHSFYCPRLALQGVQTVGDFLNKEGHLRMMPIVRSYYQDRITDCICQSHTGADDGYKFPIPPLRS